MSKITREIDEKKIKELMKETSHNSYVVAKELGIRPIDVLRVMRGDK